MVVLAETKDLSSVGGALERLEQFLSAHRSKRQPSENFEQFEREPHGYFVAAECEVLGNELARWDMELPMLEIDRQSYRRVLRSETTYLSAAGPVRAELIIKG